ncbi:MAG: hypothetical protein H3C59_00725 [Burkholderiaceae bacterium]|nr:hypothetical protein [Burkholderiaceae bacterium]
MCEVCAVFGRGKHWTARASGESTALEAFDIRRHRDERREALRVLNAVLRDEGVRVADWDGESYQLVLPTGAFVVAADLADVWPALKRLGLEAPDLLSRQFLERNE